MYNKHYKAQFYDYWAPCLRYGPVIEFNIRFIFVILLKYADTRFHTNISLF